MSMKKQFLHLSVYRCDTCEGPVVSGSLAIRENEISREGERQKIGAICLACGHVQSEVTAPAIARHIPPIEWNLNNAIDPDRWSLQT